MSHHVHARTYVVRAYVLPEAAGRGKIFLNPGFLPQNAPSRLLNALFGYATHGLVKKDFN